MELETRRTSYVIVGATTKRISVFRGWFVGATDKVTEINMSGSQFVGAFDTIAEIGVFRG